jgi:hypothetical protein
MHILSLEEWRARKKRHEEILGPIADSFVKRRDVLKKHPVYDFLFTYYALSPTKLKQWIPSFEEALSLEGERDLPAYFDAAVFCVQEGCLALSLDRLSNATRELVYFVQNLCSNILEKPLRFGCFGLHEWAMVYRTDALRHNQYSLRLPPDCLAEFIESQKLLCTHYDAYRFFTPLAKPLNGFSPTLEDRLDNEQGGCLHANMDLYKWAGKLWPWIGSDFLCKTFLLAYEGRELDMRASPYDLQEAGFAPICIETEEGRKEYQKLQQQYAEKAKLLRMELLGFCKRLIAKII